MLTPTDRSQTPSAALLRTEVVVRWKVHAPALPEEIRSQLPETRRNEAILELRVRLRNGGVEYAQGFIATDEGDTPEIPLQTPKNALEESACVGLQIMDDGSLIHLDAPNFLVCTLRGAAESWRRGRHYKRLLYARTPIIRELGLPGGRYEPLDAHVRVF